MAKNFKVVIAGAGPGGCVFARDLALAGIDVTIYEKGEYESLGHNWSDAVERNALQAVGLDVPAEGPVNKGTLVKIPGKNSKDSAIFEQHAYPQMEVWAPDLSCKKQIHFRYITTDRRALGKLLADQARDAGAVINFNHEVIAPVLSGGKTLSDVIVTGIKVKNLKNDEETVINADITVDDTGFKAQLRTQLPEETCIAMPFSDDEFAMVHRTVRKRDQTKTGEDQIIDHYRYGYQTGYQWVQELNDQEIDVGAGIKFNADVLSPKDTVEEFISRHPSITEEIVRGGGGKCLVGRSPFSLVASGFMVLGDAASQTIPMTGCGAGGAMMGGKLAAETVIEAQKNGSANIESLWSYNHKWYVQSGRGSNYAALTALRNILQKLPQDDNSFLFNKDVFSGEMLTASINGIFRIPDLSMMVKTLVGCISKPGLLLTLNKATTIGTKLHKHYLNYPSIWNPSQFEKWKNKTEQLFAKVS